LRSSIERLGVDQTHTLRGLDSYERGIEQAAQDQKLAMKDSEVRVDPEDRDYPVLPVPDKKSRFGSRNVPAYTKQGFPNVLQNPPAAETFGRPTTTGSGVGGTGSLFPKIPGAEENYGMVHNIPETPAEKAMHELWMARRRQEVRV
jgi:hypothetical protein